MILCFSVSEHHAGFPLRGASGEAFESTSEPLSSSSPTSLPALLSPSSTPTLSVCPYKVVLSTPRKIFLLNCAFESDQPFLCGTSCLPSGRFSSQLAVRPVEAQLGFVARKVYSALEGGASLV